MFDRYMSVRQRLLQREAEMRASGGLTSTPATATTTATTAGGGGGGVGAAAGVGGGQGETLTLPPLLQSDPIPST